MLRAEDNFEFLGLFGVRGSQAFWGSVLGSGGSLGCIDFRFESFWAYLVLGS